MKEARDVLRPMNDDARRLARSLVRAARYGALASLQPDGTPLCSRVLVACSEEGDRCF